MRKLFTALLIITLGTNFVFGAVQLNRLIDKANKNFTLLERIKPNYPSVRDMVKQIGLLEKEWKEGIADYRRSTNQSRAHIIKLLRTSYLRQQKLLRVICSDLDMYSRDILLHFTDKLGEKKYNHITQEKYQNELMISKRDFIRAQKVFRQKHYNYSAHLYNRGIVVMAKLYKKLKLPFPSGYGVKISSSTNSK